MVNPVVPGPENAVAIPDFLMGGLFNYDDAVVSSPPMPRCSVSRDGELVFRTSEIFHREKRIVAVVIGMKTPRVCWADDKAIKGNPPICASSDGRKGSGTCHVSGGEKSFLPLAFNDREAFVKAGYEVDDGGYFTAGADDMTFERLCAGCPMAEFGSALRGRGQRCKLTVRLALYIPTIVTGADKSIAPWLSDETGEKPGKMGPPVILSVSPTNFDSWDAYAKWMSKTGTGKVAPWGFWTTIEASKKEAGGYEVGKLDFSGRMMEASHAWFYQRAKELQQHSAMSEFAAPGSAADYQVEE